MSTPDYLRYFESRSFRFDSKVVSADRVKWVEHLMHDLLGNGGVIGADHLAQILGVMAGAVKPTRSQNS
jgi:hypothetical protein